MLTIPLLLLQFLSFRPPADPNAILVGSWESCMEKDSYRREWIFDYRILGKPVFEFHMGPGSEFAVFPGVQDEHRDHNLVSNLLKPTHTAGDVEHPPYHKTWLFSYKGVNYKLDVWVAGGSSDGCDGGSEYPEYSYWVDLHKESK